MPKQLIDKIIEINTSPLRQELAEQILRLSEEYRNALGQLAFGPPDTIPLRQALAEQILHLSEEYVNNIGVRLESGGWSLTAVGQEFWQRLSWFMRDVPAQYWLQSVARLANAMARNAVLGEALDFWVAAERHVAAIACRTVATSNTLADAIEKTYTFNERHYLEGIRISAYYIWEASGKTSGHALEDWLYAEARALALNVADLPVSFEANWASWDHPLPDRAPSSNRRSGGEEPPTPAYIRFTVYHPKEIKPQFWFTLLAYVHILEMQSTVEADAKRRLEVSHGCRSATATHGISRGSEIIVSPELPGCRFNPTSVRLLWLEDWHRVEFRLQAQTDLSGFELGKPVNGRLAFYVESVLVAEVPIWTCISDTVDTIGADAPAGTTSAEPYEAIFVSYSHQDSAVVNRLGRAYKALGMKFLRDVEELRSGEEWNSALLEMIKRANIFQLYWSRAAKHSRNVEAEWRHALEQNRSHFIRPLYWQVPMPEPPSELARLHFSYLELDN